MKAIEGDMMEPADRARLLAFVAEHDDPGGVVWEDTGLSGTRFALVGGTLYLAPAAFELHVAFLEARGVNLADRMVRKSTFN